MSGNGWRSVRLSEIEPLEGCEPELEWLPVRHRLEVSAFGVNAWRGREPGDLVIEEHDELNDGALDQEELYLVLEGHATFTVDGREVDAPRGTFVFVKDPVLTRKAVAREAETVVLAVGAAPNQPFSVSPWERRQLERAGV